MWNRVIKICGRIEGRGEEQCCVVIQWRNSAGRLVRVEKNCKSIRVVSVVMVAKKGVKGDKVVRVEGVELARK